MCLSSLLLLSVSINHVNVTREVCLYLSHTLFDQYLDVIVHVHEVIRGANLHTIHDGVENRRLKFLLHEMVDSVQFRHAFHFWVKLFLVVSL